MKRIMNIPKLLLKISLVFVLTIYPLDKIIAQSLYITNCFQKIQLTNGKNVKFLYLGGENKIFFRSPGDEFPYFFIRQFDPVSGEFKKVEFSLPVEVITDAAGNPLTVYENAFPYLGLTLPSSQPIVMDFYGYGPAYTPLSITMEFISASEAFDFKPFNKSCFTYDNLQFKGDFLKLEGLCMNQYYFLTLPPDAPDKMGLSQYTERVRFSNTSESAPINIPIDPNRCSDPGYGCQASSPCGCINFNMEITLFSCYMNQTGSDCPDKKTIYVPIKICCRCGTPDNPDFPSAGRKTDNTTLTGQNSELSIFPNPNHSGKLQVNATNYIQNIKIYAVDGRLVKNISLKELNQNKVSVDISGLKPGMYQVQVRDQVNTVSNQKLLIQ